MQTPARPSPIGGVGRRRFLALAAGALALPAVAPRRAPAAPSTKIRAMLLTGQMNKSHNWEVSSPILKRQLEASGRFDVAVVQTPPRGGDLSGFQPAWKEHDVVVLDYDGDDWPAATREAFVGYVAGGGGLVIYHSTDNAFPNWKEFNEMIGLGGWGGRNEVSGPKVRWRDGKMVLDPSPGNATHPPRHDFPITARDPEHPILRGLPPVWMHAQDELYSQLRGPAKNLHLLATGFADQTLKNATGEHEPALFTVAYGEGRVFHTTLGHVGAKDKEPVAPMNCVGFTATFQRGAEWAATGAVTLPAPADFPAADRTSIRA